MDCVDLRPIAKANRWSWHFEQSWKHERDPAARADGRWYVEIRCKRGLIYPWGEQDLLAYVPRRALLKELLAIGDGVRVHQLGDGGSRLRDREAVVRFHVDLLDLVAGVLRPKKLGGRVPTPEDLDRLAYARENLYPRAGFKS